MLTLSVLDQVEQKVITWL